MSCIFIVEDDPLLGSTLQRNLELEGYIVVWSRDLATAERQWSNSRADLIILDWNLPDGVGIEFCRRIRLQNPKIPILFLTAESSEETAVEALIAGAQDYLRKPCGGLELSARIRRMLGEALKPDLAIRFEDLVLYLGSRKAKYRDAELSLHRKEFDVLAQLIQNGDVISTRAAILEVIDPEQMIADRAVDAHMSRLRHKLKTAGIMTIEIRSIYGEGYRLEKADA